MAHKQVLFSSAAREKLLRGATQLADAVRVTFGPKSKSVLIWEKWGAQAAEKTGELVGDGTGTAIIVAHAIFADGVRNVVAGASAIGLNRGLDRVAKAAIESLKAMSRPVKTREDWRTDTQARP